MRTAQYASNPLEDQFMRGRLRRAGIAGIGFILASLPASAIETADPVTMSREIFALYGKEGSGFALTGPKAGLVLAPGLLALLLADEKAAGGEVGSLGADPLCSCQDYDITAVKPTAQLLGPDKAEVSVAFRNFGKPAATRLSLVSTAKGWRIADIHTKDIPSLVALLRQAAHR